MQTYTCPTCGEKMERDLSLFMEHTDRHIVDEVKKRHPSWVTEDGFCAKCLEHFKLAMRDPAAAEKAENLDPAGARRRLFLGVAGFGGAAAVFFWLRSSEISRTIAGLLLFVPLFAGFLGLFQARTKFCVVVAQKQSKAMRKRAFKMLELAVLLAIALTVLLTSLVYAASEEAGDKLDHILIQLTQGSAEAKAKFYPALLEAELYVGVERAGKESAEITLLTEPVKDVETVLIYTDYEQLARNPNAPKDHVVMFGKDLLKLIAKTGREAALNPFSGHGGRLTASKIQEIVAGAV